MSLRDQLQAIYNERGELTPATVVHAATPPEHPLHERFEWNDKVAAHEHRKNQAAEMIRSVKVTYGEPQANGEKKSVRAFVAVRGDGPSSRYEPVEKAMTDDFTRQLLLAECKREWRAFERKYGDLEEFAAIVGLKTA
jgi:hypothetical protein